MPQSFAQLTRGRGANSELVGFLLPFARQDFIYVEDDFINITLDTTNGLWALGTDAGGTAFAQGALEGGTIRAQTAATDNNQVQIRGGAGLISFAAARNPGAEIRWKVDTVNADELEVEFGFSDPLTDNTLSAVTDVDTPATGNGATDLVVIHMDGDQTLKTYALVTDGGTPAAAKTNFATSVVPVAATYARMLVQAYSNAGFGVIDNDFVNKAAGVDTGPDAAVLMRPHFTVATLAAVDKIIDIDYIRLWAERP